MHRILRSKFNQIKLSKSVTGGRPLRGRSSLINYVKNFEDAMHILTREKYINSKYFEYFYGETNKNQKRLNERNHGSVREV